MLSESDHSADMSSDNDVQSELRSNGLVKDGVQDNETGNGDDYTEDAENT